MSFLKIPSSTELTCQKCHRKIQWETNAQGLRFQSFLMTSGMLAGIPRPEKMKSTGAYKTDLPLVRICKGCEVKKER